MHAQQSRGARCLIFGWTLHLLPYYMCANNEGSGICAGSPEPWLVPHMLSTIISWAGSIKLWYSSSFVIIKQLIKTFLQKNSSKLMRKGHYQTGEKRRLRQACTSMQSCQSLHCFNKEPYLWPRLGMRVWRILNHTTLESLFSWDGSFYHRNLPGHLN